MEGGGRWTVFGVPSVVSRHTLPLVCTTPPTNEEEANESKQLRHNARGQGEMSTAVGEKRSADAPADGQPDAKSMQKAEARAAFMEVFAKLKAELLAEEPIVSQPEIARVWMERMMQYNVPWGKLNRGMAVKESLRAIEQSGQGTTADKAFQADVLGWCIEWLQAFFLVADDMMDGSLTRRGQDCWYKVKDVGMVAINDCILLEAHIYAILKTHFRKEPYYLELLELFHEVTYQTSTGQMLDLITAPIGTVDLSRYTMEAYMRIVTYKTAYYTFYLPVACAMHMAGIKDDAAFETTRSICLKMGQFFQIQDDYLDCYGDPEVIGKVGTDIEDNKCSWLVVQALIVATEEQKRVLENHYGKSDGESVAKVKQLYRDLAIEGKYEDYEQRTYGELVDEINKQKHLPKAVFEQLLAKIYKRQK